jgi:hypothetical protein
MGIETDLNKNPYYDDIDNALNDNYHRILFRPAVPVQARELTQLQDILQNQIERFGDNIYEAGTILKGCNFNFDSNYYYAKILDLRPTDGQPANPSQYVGMLAHEPTSNLYAICVNYQDGFETQDPDMKTLYFKYVNSGINNEQVFGSGTQLQFYTNTNVDYANSTNYFSNGDVKISTVNNAVGQGYSMSVSSGIIFQKGHFIQVANNTSTIVSKYSNVPDSVVVGFNINENIITEFQDSNLLDNAAGYSNLNAPGAHRLQLLPTLVAYPASSVPSSNFFALVEWEAGNITKSFQQTQYSGLGNELARRTSEESGDYFIKPFKVHLESANDTHNYVVSSAGLAYIEGHRVEQLNNIRTPIRKGNDLKTVTNQIINTNYNNSILVQEFVGSFPSNIGSTISLRDTAGNKITTDTFSTSITPSGLEIGTAKILAVEYESGTVGTPSAQYRVYLSDIRMNIGKNFRDVKSVYYSGSPSGFADVILTFDSTSSANIAIISEPSKSSLIFKTAKTGLDNLAGTGSLPDYIYRMVNTSVVITTTGNSNLIDVTGSSVYPYGQGILSQVQEQDIIVVPTSFSSGANFANVTIAKTGNVAIVSNTSTVTSASGNTTAFSAEYMVGDYICVANTVKRIINISNNSFMNVDSTWATSNSGTTHNKTYPVNVPINFSDRNSYISITDSSLQHMQLSLLSTANVAETLSANMTATVHANVLIPSDSDRNLEANTNITVRLNLANNAGGTSGPWCLGIPYVYNIKNVYRSSNVGTFSGNTISSNSFLSTNTSGFANGVCVSGPGIVSGTTANVANSTTLVLSSPATSNITSGQFTYGYYSNSASDDITQTFLLKDGQKDSFFDLSFLSKNPDYSNFGLNSTDLLTVVFDAFRPKNIGKGYISIDSYDSIVHGYGVIGYENIPSYTSTSGTYYELRDCIDFRPFAANTTSYQSSVSNSVINPAYSSVLPNTENYIVAPNETFKYSAQYYVGRIDKLMINSYGAYSIVEGTPSETPVAPSEKNGSMTLAVINVPPIPSLASTNLTTNTATNYVVTSNTTNQNRGYTMKEIGKIDQRVNNLEYYTSLNLLEQQTNSLTIVSSVTGANRFKNGIFVDDFSTVDSLDITNNEFKASLSSSETSLVPMVVPTSVSMRYVSGSNTIQQGSFVTLSNTSNPVAFITQKFASDKKVCTDNYYNYVGTVGLSPSYSDLPELNGSVNSSPTSAYTVGSLNLLIQDDNYSTIFSGYTDSVNGSGGFFQIPRMEDYEVNHMINNAYGTNINYAVHLTQHGYFIPPETGSYVFSMAHDDGYVFTINGNTYSNPDHDPTEYTAPIQLTAGVYYPISFSIDLNNYGAGWMQLGFVVNGNNYVYVKNSSEMPSYPGYKFITNSMFARDTTPKLPGSVPWGVGLGIPVGAFGFGTWTNIPGVYPAPASWSIAPNTSPAPVPTSTTNTNILSVITDIAKSSNSTIINAISKFKGI